MARRADAQSRRAGFCCLPVLRMSIFRFMNSRNRRPLWPRSTWSLCRPRHSLPAAVGRVPVAAATGHVFRSVDFALPDDAGNLRLNLQRDILGFAGCFVDDDKVTAIVATELLVGVQKLDAIDRTIWRNVHVE